MSRLMVLFFVLGLSFTAFAQDIYNRDSFSLQNDKGKFSLHISGNPKGVLAEIMGYLKSSGVKPEMINGWAIFQGPQDFNLVAMIPKLSVNLKPEDILGMSGGNISSPRGTFETVQIGGAVAEWLLKTMEKAGVTKYVFPGDSMSYSFDGKSMRCSYTSDLWKYSCELQLLEDLKQYK